MLLALRLVGWSVFLAAPELKFPHGPQQTPSFHFKARLTTAKRFRGAAFQTFDFPSCSAAAALIFSCFCLFPTQLSAPGVILQRAPAYLFKPARSIVVFSSLLPPSILISPNKRFTAASLSTNNFPSTSITLTL
jgi:hypothetical protein